MANFMKCVSQLTMSLKIFSLLGLITCFSQSVADDLPIDIAQALKPYMNDATIGIHVQAVDSNKPWFSLNATKALNPASTMKLVTTYAGLEILGANHVWKTQIYTFGNVVQGVLNGDLYVKGGADPALTIERFVALLAQAKQRGLTEVRGNLVLDRTRYQLPADDPSAFDNEPDRPYNVLPDPLLVNFKAVKVMVAPDASGKQIDVKLEPHPRNVLLNPQIRLVSGVCNSSNSRLNIGLQPIGSGSAQINVAGVYSNQCAPQEFYRALLAHPNYVYGTFRQVWEDAGGKLTGVLVENKTTPANATLWTEIASPPLKEVIRDINKHSNNVMARQVFLSLSSQLPWSVASSAARIKQWLIQKKLNFPELVLDNGAGLSRTERISPEHLGQMLNAAWQSPVREDFVASLPVVANDGTMKNRLKDSGVAGRAFIKTGTLGKPGETNVRAIAGYVIAASGKVYSVVAILNTNKPPPMGRTLDVVVRYVYEKG